MTESLYVDEEGSFQPFISAAVRPGLEYLKLAVVAPINVQAVYSFEGSKSEIEPVVVGESFEHQYSKTDPEVGIHTISWEKI